MKSLKALLVALSLFGAVVLPACCKKKCHSSKEKHEKKRHHDKKMKKCKKCKSCPCNCK